MAVKTILDHIGLLWTMTDSTEELALTPRQGRAAMREVGAVEHAAIAIDDEGRILAAGPRKQIVDLADENTLTIDAQGGFVCPGFVDPHTHLVYGGSREHELPMRLAGATYLDILQAGGGILRTVRDTRAASHAELLAKAAGSLERMLSFGVTTVEAKSGYGLDYTTELKQIEVAVALAQSQPIDIVLTALPAHALPNDPGSSRENYVQEVIRWLPGLKAAGAEFADVFIEKGVFTLDEGRQILSAARDIGYGLKIHADEMEPLGGAELAAELGAVSADHLLAASDAGLMQMAASQVVAVCLPATSFYLQKPAARARFMIDEAKLAVAIASDYNPGSAPSENFALTMSLALLTLKMSPEEVFMAATRNSAHALRRGDVAGVIAKGRPADLVWFAAPNPAFVLTRFGISHVAGVFKHGNLIYRAHS